jgi:fructose-bisphosphate aldolase class 1
MNAQELIVTARELVADDKGLLAMDESNPTCNKRFAKLGIPQTEDARRSYRELIVTTPDLCDNISGVILVMNVRFKSQLPWALAFSFARAIQQPALEIWRGEEVHVAEAQKALYHRARCNQAARRGEYNAAMEAG